MIKNNMSSATAENTIDNEKIRSGMEVITDILTLEFLRRKKKKIAILRLEGVIGKAGIGSKGMSFTSLNSLIEQAFNTPKLTAILLAINSPGGSPVQSELISSRIISLSSIKKIPVYSFIEDVGASGGYWLACAGQEIYASKSSIVGSIGVVSRGFGFTSAIEKLGIERRVHTAGKNKSVLDPFKAEKKSDIEIIKKIQLNIHENFINYVKSRRIGKLTQDDDILFNGEFWTGETANDFGLIDGINDMYNFIKEKWGEDVKIENISPKESWFKKKFGISRNNFSSEFALSLKEEMKNLIEEADLENKYNIK